MLKSDEEVERLLNHTNNGLNKIKVQTKFIGRGNHDNHSTEERPGPQIRSKEDQAIVGTLANLIGGKNTSELLNINQSEVSKFRNGKNGSGVPNSELKSKIEEKLEKVNEKVADKVDILIDIFTEEKMSELKASEIPSAADKLISVFDKIKRRNEGNGNNSFLKPQVILYAPKQINITELITKEV